MQLKCVSEKGTVEVERSKLHGSSISDNMQYGNDYSLFQLHKSSYVFDTEISPISKFSFDFDEHFMHIQIFIKSANFSWLTITKICYSTKLRCSLLLD